MEKNFLFFASKTFTFATQSRGSKQYELTDHLGNIRTVVPDIKEPLSLPQNQNFRLPTLTLNNYYPYGMLQAGRSKNAGGYRFGFNGMEQTKGVQGNSQGTFYDYKNRDYDPWSIRFKRTDALESKYPFYSPYQFAGNKSINSIDLDGLEEWVQIRKYTSYEDQKPIISYYFDETIKKSGTGLSWVLHKYDGFQRSELMSDIAIPMNAIEASSSPEFSEGDNFSIRSNYTKPLQPFKNPQGKREDLLDEFTLGFGPTNSLFLSDHPMTESMKNAPEVARLRKLMYDKYNGNIPKNGSYTNFAGKFGLGGLLDAGTDITEQFVGTFTGDVFVDDSGENLVFVLSDAKSAQSFLYRMSPSWERHTPTSNYMGMGNTYQKYTWTEPIKNEERCSE